MFDLVNITIQSKGFIRSSTFISRKISKDILFVGDVVLMSQSGKRQAFFVDIIGFKEIEDFCKSSINNMVVKKTDVLTVQSKKRKLFSQNKWSLIERIFLTAPACFGYCMKPFVQVK